MNKLIAPAVLAGILAMPNIAKSSGQESGNNLTQSRTMSKESEKKTYFIGFGLQLSSLDFLPILKTLDERVGDVAEELDTDVQYLSLTLTLESFANDHFLQTDYFEVASGVSLGVMHPAITGVREDNNTVYPENIPPLDLRLRSSLQLYSAGIGMTPQFYHQEGKVRAAIVFPLRISGEIMRTSINYKAEPVDDYFKEWLKRLDIDADGTISISGPGLAFSAGLGVEFGYNGYFCRNVIGKRWYAYQLRVDSDAHETVSVKGSNDTLDLWCGFGF
ncbi:MAG: hypothetical protein Q8Q01_04400 [archaeon]|nr:hypothetical protein [archaeon]